MTNRSTFIPLLVLISAWGLAFYLSCHLANFTNSIGDNKNETTLGGAILGESRLAFSKHFEKKADLYLHQGVEQQHKQAFTNSLFQIMYADISPTRHVHVKDIDAKETLPWLWLSIKMDPHNIETYLIAAYWLSCHVKRPDIAHQVLHTGRINNPMNYEIDVEDGMAYLKENKYAEAFKAFSSALSLWPSKQDPVSEDAIIGKIQILFYLSLLNEINNDIPNALACMKEIQKFEPNDANIQARITSLETGNKPSRLAEQMLHAMLKSSSEAVPCHRDNDHDHECDDHDHCDSCGEAVHYDN